MGPETAWDGGEERDFANQLSWLCLAPPFTHFMTKGMSLHLLEPQFPPNMRITPTAKVIKIQWCAQYIAHWIYSTDGS